MVEISTGLLYKSNLNSGSVLEYALAFTSAALDRHHSKWSATPKTGFIDITTSKDFYRVFSGLQYVSRLHYQISVTVCISMSSIIYRPFSQQLVTVHSTYLPQKKKLKT